MLKCAFGRGILPTEVEALWQSRHWIFERLQQVWMIRSLLFAIVRIGCSLFASKERSE